MEKFIMARQRIMGAMRSPPRPVGSTLSSLPTLILRARPPRKSPLASLDRRAKQVHTSRGRTLRQGAGSCHGRTDVGTKLDPVQNELKALNAALRTVRDEHAFLMERETKHRQGK